MAIKLTEHLTIILIIILIVFPLAFVWVIMISKMKREHPNYKGEDLFDEENQKIVDDNPELVKTIENIP